MGEHAPASRELDESLRSLREALVVAGQTTPPDNPAKGTFHHPPPGEDGETALGILGLWLGFNGVGIVRSAQTPHGLHNPPQMLLDPFQKLPPVMTVTPEELHPGKALFQWLDQL